MCQNCHAVSTFPNLFNYRSMFKLIKKQSNQVYAVSHSMIISSVEHLVGPVMMPLWFDSAVL